MIYTDKAGRKSKYQPSELTICMNVLMHDFQLLGEVHHHVVRVKQGSEGTINNLGSVGRVGTNVGQQQTGPKRFILFFYF